jgi:hypothetical protein
VKPIRIKVLKDGRYFRTVCPRDDAGVFQSEANEQSANRRSSDMLVEALGLNDDGVNAWLTRHMPGQTPCAETRAEAAEMGRRVVRRIGSNDGRKPPVVDMVTANGVGINLKLVSSDEHAEVIMTTARSSTANQTIMEMAGAPLWALQVKSSKEDDTFTIDLSNLEWCFVPAASLIAAAGGDLVSLSACARGGGRPKRGEVLPFAWANWKKTDCLGGSIQVKVRGLKKGEPGWSTGTIHDLRAALAALV